MSSHRPQQAHSFRSHVFESGEAGAKKLLLAASNSVNQPVDNFMAYEAAGLRRSRHISQLILRCAVQASQGKLNSYVCLDEGDEALAQHELW